MTNIKSKVIKGAAWTLLEKFSIQLVSFCVTLVLARLLTPTDYGTVALLTIFTTVFSVLIDFGFGSALVQKKNATELDFNSVFYLSIALSLIAYTTLFSCAPLIAQFYNIPELKWIVRVVSLHLVFSAINSVQGAELTRKMLFHLSFRISLISTIPSAVVGMALAFWGFGPWSLVWQGFIAAIIGVVARWVIIAWRPKFMFSLAALKGLFSFGWKMSANSLIEVAFDNAWGLVIGKVYQPADLAYVNKGKHLPSLVMDTINGTLGRVTFPALVQFQDDKERIREATRRIIKASSFMIFPAMMGCAVCAENIICLLFGDRWMASVPYAQFACFQYALWPLSLVQMTLVAIGRSDILVAINIVRKIIGFAIMGATLWISPLVFMGAMAFVYTPVCTWTNTIPNKKLFDYTFLDEIKDVFTIVVSTLVMSIVVWGIDFCLKKIGLGGYAAWVLAIRLFVQIIAGIGIYAIMAIMLKVSALADLLKMVQMKVAGRHARIADFSARLISWIESPSERRGDK